jgi:hypothetical protein
MLASQGFNVVKLQKNTNEQPLAYNLSSKNERQREVDQFINELNGQIEMIREKGIEV